MKPAGSINALCAEHHASSLLKVSVPGRAHRIVHPETPMIREKATIAHARRDYAILEPMANPEHVAVLRTAVDDWNRIREEDPELRPDLLGADLSGANLVMADLRYAILRDANLAVANLTGADLRWADLRGANLVGARLIGVDFEGADFRGTDLRTAEDLTLEQLEETIGDEDTQLPEGLERPQRWTTEAGAR